MRNSWREDQTIIQLLTELKARVSRVVIEENKDYHQGLLALKAWDGFDTEGEDFFNSAVGVINKALAFSKGSNEHGRANMLSVLQSIGSVASRMMELDDPTSYETWQMQGHIGSAFVSVFIDFNFIFIERASKSHCWEIVATPLWYLLSDDIARAMMGDLSAISFNKPRNINRFYQPNRSSIVKRSPASLFDKLEGSNHLKGMDVIQQTGWKINTAVLDAALSVPEPALPDIPSGSKKKLVWLEHNVLKDPSLKGTYEDAMVEWEVKRNILKLHSEEGQRKSTLFKAESLRFANEFYYYIDADYRGRLYYMESFLHYQGSDLAKSLLLFSKPRPLTASGKKWLLIHAACCYNATVAGVKVDKLSLSERKGWSTNNLEFIREIADRKILHPEAEKPYMFLAACIEIVEAWETGMTKLPLPIDASNNGSQHAAAINKDVDTAMQVGMVPTLRPNDIYMNVGKEMIDIYPEFFNERNMDMGSIRKNFSKRATMVRAYSAGAKSIAANMWSDCVKSGAHKTHGISPQDCKTLSKVSIIAIDKICPANSKLRGFLQKVVEHEILTNGQKVITWTTCSGFPVVCKLNTTYSVSLKTSIGGKRINLKGRWDTMHPSYRDHLSAIAANFVHSNDSSHMVNTAMNWDGEFFGAVHDSYAVHASDVDELVNVVKAEFIKMYDCDDYYDTIKDMLLTNPQGFDTPNPELGSFELTSIEDSCFFFC